MALTGNPDKAEIKRRKTTIRKLFLAAKDYHLAGDKKKEQECKRYISDEVCAIFRKQ